MWFDAEFDNELLVAEFRKQPFEAQISRLHYGLLALTLGQLNCECVTGETIFPDSDILALTDAVDGLTPDTPKDYMVEMFRTVKDACQVALGRLRALGLDGTTDGEEDTDATT